MPSSTPASLNPTVAEVTQRIRERFADHRVLYEQRMTSQHKRGVHRAKLSCGNLTHSFATGNPRDMGSTAQFAGRVPTMCDGVTHLDHYHEGLGRELFGGFRHLAMRGEEDAGVFGGFEADDLARPYGQILQEDA